MKKSFLSILAALMLCACCHQTTNERPQPTLSWGNDCLYKYRDIDSVRQIIAVQVTEGSNALVLMLEKSEQDGKTIWTETLRCDGVIGRKGLGKTKEGDMLTPQGDYGVTTAFGIKSNPGTSLPYIDVDEFTYCCGDSVAYNQIIDIRQHMHNCDNGEHMIDYTPHYNYGMFLDYNKECTIGKGSGIFFHCFGINPYTAGCVAVSEEHMAQILRSVDKNVRVVIDYMPH